MTDTQSAVRDDFFTDAQMNVRAAVRGIEHELIGNDGDLILVARGYSIAPLDHSVIVIDEDGTVARFDVTSAWTDMFKNGQRVWVAGLDAPDYQTGPRPLCIVARGRWHTDPEGRPPSDEWRIRYRQVAVQGGPGVAADDPVPTALTLSLAAVYGPPNYGRRSPSGGHGS